MYIKNFAYIFIDGNITGGSDYVSGPYSVRFRRGSIIIPFAINIINDNRLESEETFNLTISSTLLPVGISIANPQTATVSIVDDECKLLSYANDYKALAQHLSVQLHLKL